jgi:rhodanese-related sulfurtransferase
MVFTVIVIIALSVAGGAALSWRKRQRERRLLEAHSILPEDLHRLLDTPARPRVYDVRQPLDLLAYSEIIPGSERMSPKEIQANPSLIPRDQDSVVYCTCPGDKTAVEIVQKALSLQFVKVRILKGGLEAWKAKGYPVEPYVKSFHLDTPV